MWYTNRFAHISIPNEAVLVIYGILSDGRKILLHMESGNKESYDFCQGFLRWRRIPMEHFEIQEIKIV